MVEPSDAGGIDPDREALLGVLMRHRVAFVLIGGVPWSRNERPAQPVVKRRAAAAKAPPAACRVCPG
jgi:hypothetical protein